ncbi:dTDP-glucose 4,6-dehydratase-like [Corticium candelabrum]|uniref:dTDP-glucose 4,6-dehydratase-like n=1 Tax=Corticium candelabrum TaxID=121492 RepID=UPI002E26FA3B|nr:dTDP-glucose 4,6-dehydratase-like [Corticium candelabrum]
MASKPRVLIFGGCGFIGRHLVTYLVDNKLVEKVRVVDKVPPSMAWFNEKDKATFRNSIVEFKSANLSVEANVQKSFDDPDGDYNYVINLAAETKYSQSEAVYEERVYRVTVNCAREAAKRKVTRYIEVSTAQIYSSVKKSSHEHSKLDPWTEIAKFKLKAEEEISRIQGLDYVVLRPAVVYGIGDKLGVTPRLIIGAVYRELKETMKLLWGKDLKINTVHVRDVCRAIWHVCTEGNSREVYNLADKGETDQGRISSLVAQIFDIKHDYYGSLTSGLAQLSLSSIQEDSNEKHLRPWSDACIRDNVMNTPLSPFLDKELFANKHLHVDGKKIESTGFEYKVPEMTVELLKEIVDDYLALGLFPPSLLPSV